MIILGKSWANVLSLNNEIMTYWVWIPRFAYNSNNFVEETLDGATYQTMAFDASTSTYSDLEVVFVDTTNHYYVDGEAKELSDGWIVPDGFSFDGQSLPGFWMSKYEVQQNSGNNGDFYITASVDAIGVTTADSSNSEIYSVFIDSEDSAVLETNLNTARGVTQLASGVAIQPDTTYLVSIYDHYGIRKWTQSVHTLTYQPESEIYNNISVDISGFEASKSYFVLYDQDGANPMLVPFQAGTTTKSSIESYLSGLGIDYNDADGDGDGYFWYNYGDKRGEGYKWPNFGGTKTEDIYKNGVAKIWANIATMSNNSISYWTYIPRYCYYQVGGISSTSFDTRFIPSAVTSENINEQDASGENEGVIYYTSVDISENYVIPDAFGFDSRPLSGYWMSKYEVESKESKPSFYVVVDGNYIQIMNKLGSTSSTINPGTNYTVSIIESGKTEDKGTNTPRTSSFKTSALSYSTDYEVKVYANIRAKVMEGGKLVDGYVKVLQLSETIRTADEPVNYDYANISVDLTGFETEKTAFVLYNGTTEVSDTSNTYTLKTLKENGTWTGGDWDKDELIFHATAGKATVTYSGKTYTWFDYANKIWANIRTFSGGTKTYFTYVPRYAYQLNEETASIAIKYININNQYSANGTQTTIGSDWVIPDGFTFAGTQLRGFWMSKYEVQKYSD